MEITLSGVLVFFSGCIWLGVFIPQLIKNYRTSSVEGLSFNLILLWLMGDNLSLMSAKVLNNNPVIVYTNIFNIFMDSTLIFQWFYYNLQYSDYEPIANSIPTTPTENIPRNPTTETTRRIATPRAVVCSYFITAFDFMKRSHCKREMYKTIGVVTFIFFLKTMMAFAILTWRVFLARTMAWTIPFISISCRLTQMYHNYTRQNVIGLSPFTFILIFTANNLFLGSIFARLRNIPPELHWVFLHSNIQWIASICIANVLDILLFLQIRYYSRIISIHERYVLIDTEAES